MDDDMIGTQVPPLETSPVDGDTRIDDGVEGLRANEVDSDGEMRDNEYGGEDGGDLDKALFGNENEDGEEQNLTGEFLLDQEDVVPGLDGPYDYADSTDDVVQPDDSSQGTIRETVENDHGTEFQHDQSRVDSTMSSQDEELREEGSGQIDEAQPGQHNSEQEQEQERIDIGSGQAQRGFTPRCPSIKDNHYEDSSALFVSQSPSPPPQTQPPPHFTRLPAPATRTPPSARVSTPSRQPAATSQLSTFAKIRNMQKRLQEKKNTASRNATASASNINPDNETYLEAVTSGITPSAAATKGVSPVDDDDMENRLAIAEFQKQKRHYDELKRKARDGKLTFRMDVEWMKIKGAEEARKKKRARDIAKAREEEGGEQDLFPDINNAADEVPEEESDGSSELYGTDSRKRRRGREHPRKTGKSRSMADAERHSMQVALDAGEDRPKKKKKKDEAAEGSSAGGNGPAKRSRGSKTNVSKGPSRSKAASKAPAKGGRGTAKKKLEVANAIKQATSLFNSNVFMQQAGANAREQPVFRSRVKADALKELIASVPIEDVKKVRGDINILMAATKDFDGRGSVKSDGFGLWRPKGMRTSLKGYQILGTAFMRRRENSAEEPKGGLMADQMGLGKTLMMLANIVNGQPPRGMKGPRTTLIIAGPSLLSQWKSEIEQHTDAGLRIMRYGAGTRIDSNTPEDVLTGHDIVLTTYTEVMNSYPKNEPPIECQTAEQKIEWWKDVYDRHRGVLHRTMFLRVVLDEAQAIKNHVARTSIACRALMAQHKWALSGTPILNNLTELYPYFKFLGVPHTGSFKIFKHNYCNHNDADNIERLLVRLASFMIRRTHADEMFGAPILKLPQADQNTYWCEFNSVERTIYDIVHERFAKNINMWAQSGELDRSYSNALVMLLRLRQLTAHVLMLQFVMRDLLHAEDIERIKQVLDERSESSDTRQGKTILAIRKQLDQHAEYARKKRITLEKAKAVAKAAGREFNEHDVLIDEDIEDEDSDADADEEDRMAGNETGESSQSTRSRYTAGRQFGREYKFEPFLNSLKTGESWEKAKKKTICMSCKKQPRMPWVTSCGHFICTEPCLDKLNSDTAEDEEEQAKCTACGCTPTYFRQCDPGENVTPEFVAQGTRNAKKKKKKQKSVEHDDIPEDWLNSVGDDVLPSAKTIAIKAQILNWTQENPRVKVIVYTQFLAMIRILARICQKEGWQVEEYHGKMSLAARDKAISSFAENPDTKVMLASLRCGGLGLNLTMASKVIMVDPWWNSASEQQAFCRVFRIGQKEETFMSRLCVKDTIDSKLVAMQERKQKEIDGVMEDSGRTVKKMSIADLMRLFGNLEEDPEGKPFIMVDNPDPRGGFRADGDDEGYADEM